jgi:DNA topoisomerase-1
MIVKRGRFGPFLACSRYPDCTGSRPLLKKVGVACPKDKGDIVEKRTKKGRTFYSCANYPNCDFTSWSRPLPQPCPTCGGLVTVAARNSVKCSQCDWKGAPEDLGAEPELAKASA